MANQVWLTAGGVPFLNGSDYELWKIIIEAYLMVINENIWLSIIYGERIDFKTEPKEIIMKGLSKPNVDKVRHCETIKEMLDILQCLYGEDCNVVQEKAKETYCSSCEPKHVVVCYHPLVGSTIYLLFQTPDQPTRSTI